MSYKLRLLLNIKSDQMVINKNSVKMIEWLHNMTIRRNDIGKFYKLTSFLLLL